MRYEIDPFNRLVVSGGRSGGLPFFRRVIDGTFRMGPRNSLIYHVKKPSRPFPDGIDLPHQVKLTGRWALTDNHDLELTFDKWKRVGESVTVAGEIIGAGPDSLLFSCAVKKPSGGMAVRLLRLEGVWQADKKNRLSFLVEKGKGQYDVLTLNGAWEIDKRHQIVYTYSKSDEKGGRVRHSIAFKGFWNITGRYRVSYLLDCKAGSGFDFRTSLIKADGRHIEFEVGIGLSGGRPEVKHSVELFGRWNIDKKAGLLFEYETGEGSFQAITLGAEARLSDRDTIIFRLKGRAGEELGAELGLSRRFLNEDGEAFLRLLKSGKEYVVYAGAGWRW